jgi:hypothetical protein
VWTIFVGILLSLFAFFINWRLALLGIAFFYLFSIVANFFFAKEFDIRTIQQLTEKIARDNYLEVRRQKGTVNRNEVFKTIQNAFSADLGLDKSLLTREASLGWN